MTRNVGSNERYVRLGAGIAAAAAATQTSGWQRAALGGVAAAGLATGLSRYCPINQAVGRDAFHGGQPLLEQGQRDTELRRHASTRSALGSAPTTESGQPRVTPDADVFGGPDSRRS